MALEGKGRMQRTKRPKLCKREQVLALEAFGSDNFLKLSKKMLMQFGPALAVYTCDLVDMYRYFKEHNQLQADGSFFVVHADQMLRTGMTEHQIRSCKSRLKALDVLYTELRWAPPKEFYLINLEKLVDILVPYGKREGRVNPTESGGLTLRKAEGLYKLEQSVLEQSIYKSTSWGGGGREEEKEEDKEEEKEEETLPDKITPSMFDTFWKLYPRKVDKGKAKTKWEQLCRKKARPTWNEINTAIEGQTKTRRWEEGYIPHPTTWLNQQRWLDDPEEMNSPPSNSAAKDTPVADSPKAVFLHIQTHFGSKTLARLFHSSCYTPAKKLFGDVPVHVVIQFYDDIDMTQKRNLTPELRQLMPSAMSLTEDYLEWISCQDWVSSKTSKLLDINHKLFSRFCQDVARKDNLARHPLTGESSIRG